MPRISSPWGNIFCKFGKEAVVCLDKTIIYTRDAGGNVTQKKVYALSTQANLEGQPEQTMVYAYADGWKDQMTAVDGQAVAYDTAGNMTAYKGRKYSWCGNGILTDVIKEDGSQILGEKMLRVISLISTIPAVK